MNKHLENVGCVLNRDGTKVFLEDDQLTRIVYALCTLALTPVIEQVHIDAVYDAAGTCLWIHPNALTQEKRNG